MHGSSMHGFTLKLICSYKRLVQFAHSPQALVLESWGVFSKPWCSVTGTQPLIHETTPDFHSPQTSDK